MGADLRAFLDPHDARQYAQGKFTAENPARGMMLFGICNHAMQRHLWLTFVVEGPNAEEAAGRVRRLLDKPLRREEVSAKSALWAFGDPGSRGPKEGYERAELTATLPGKNGFECIFYQHLALRTSRLRRQAYITVVAEGEEFRPANITEHFPTAELTAYQMAASRIAGTWDEAFGKGRRLEVTFVCYSPAGSGAAREALGEIGDGLEKLREVATWPEGKRSMFGVRHGVGRVAAMVGDVAHAPYRPPEGVLSRRPRAPRPEPRPVPERKPPEHRPGPGFSEMLDDRVDSLLRSWGHGDVADERKNAPPRESTPKRRATVRGAAKPQLWLQESGQPETSTLTPTFYAEPYADPLAAEARAWREEDRRMREDAKRWEARWK